MRGLLPYVAGKGKLLLVAFILTFSLGCEEDLDGDIGVISERLLFKGSDFVRLSGRIISINTLNLSDHGFEISEDQNFSNPSRISLGEIKATGAFIGQASELKPSNQYWWRSFIVLENETFFGIEQEFLTGSASVKEFYPPIASPNSFVTLEGANFAEDIEVFFGDEKANISSRVLDYKIKVQVPPVGNEFQVKIRIVSPNETVEYPVNFEYITGEWQSLDPFPLAERARGTIFLKEGNNVMLGLGRYSNTLHAEVWESTIDNISWTQTTYPGLPVRAAFHSDKFFGGGITEETQFPGDLPTVSTLMYRYENGSFTVETSMPFFNYNGIAFDSGDYVYVLGGRDIGGFPMQQIYRYSISNGLWESVGFIPVNEIDPELPHFTHSGNFYILLNNGLLARFNTALNEWEAVSVFPESPGDEGVAVVSGNRAFIGLIDGKRTMWELDLGSFQWKPKKSLSVSITVESYGEWTNNGKLYFLFNTGLTQNNGIDLWEYDPDAF